MKKISIILLFLGIALTSLEAQKANNYFVVDGVKHAEAPGQFIWSGEIAVLNSETASFQIYFKQVPQVSGKYKVQEHLSFTETGSEKEASVVLYYFSGDQYWSVLPSKGSIQAKVKPNSITIIVKNVKICKTDTQDCRTISGQIVLPKP